MSLVRSKRSEPARRSRLVRKPTLDRWEFAGAGERLGADLERDLSRQANLGSRSARERLIQANIPLVVSVAQQFCRPGQELEDLIQEGMIGLCHAADKFDPERGFRFSTYATCWIQQRVRRASDRVGRGPHLPLDIVHAVRKAQQRRESLSEELGREPTVAELAEATGVSEKRLAAVWGCYEEPLSLDTFVTHDGESHAIDVADSETPGPEETVLTQERNLELRRALASLPARDRMVLQERFGLAGGEASLSELADRLSLTREGVRQIQRRALAKLRREWVAA